MSNNINISNVSYAATQEPLVSPPGLEDFELKREAIFPALNELINREVSPPRGLANLEASELAPVVEDAVTLNRGVGQFAPPEEIAADELIPQGGIVTQGDAEEVAAIARDQIRYEPRNAMQVQANSSPADVLAVLQ